MWRRPDGCRRAARIGRSGGGSGSSRRVCAPPTSGVAPGGHGSRSLALRYARRCRGHGTPDDSSGDHKPCRHAASRACGEDGHAGRCEYTSVSRPSGSGRTLPSPARHHACLGCSPSSPSWPYSSELQNAKPQPIAAGTVSNARPSVTPSPPCADTSGASKVSSHPALAATEQNLGERSSSPGLTHSVTPHDGQTRAK